MNQTLFPLMEALQPYYGQDRLRLHVPGHGGGPGLPPELGAILSGAAGIDLTELPGLDDLHDPTGPIALAQALAADVWQADESYFLVNGSSAGVLAMILSACAPGDEVLAPRNAHGSFYHALILSGAVPRYLPVAEQEGVPLNLSEASLGEGLERWPGVKAVFLTSPGYHGVCADVEKMAARIRRQGARFLLDEAHGAHLGFTPNLPQSHGRLADLRVQSWHKTLGALTPGAVLHRQGNGVDPLRIRAALQWVQTSSPSYPVLLSLDGARRTMALQGRVLMNGVARQAAALRRAVSGSLPLLEQENLVEKGMTLDPTRITILTGKAGICGFHAASRLRDQGIDVELALPRSILAIVGPGYREKDGERLEKAAAGLAEAPKEAPTQLPAPPLPRMGRSPREAYFSPWEYLHPNHALGRTAAGMVISYPPGIPLLAPGEVIDADVVDYLEQTSRAGIRFRGPDPEGRLPMCR
jgi:arginine decarboxylase